MVFSAIVPEAYPQPWMKQLNMNIFIIFRIGALEETIGDDGIFCDELNLGSLYKDLIKTIDSLKEN